MFIQAPNSQLITLFQPVKKVGVQLDSAMQQNFTSLCGSFQNIKKVIHCGNFLCQFSAYLFCMSQVKNTSQRTVCLGACPITLDH